MCMDVQWLIFISRRPSQQCNTNASLEHTPQTSQFICISIYIYWWYMQPSGINAKHRALCAFCRYYTVWLWLIRYHHHTIPHQAPFGSHLLNQRTIIAHAAKNQIRHPHLASLLLTRVLLCVAVRWNVIITNFFVYIMMWYCDHVIQTHIHRRCLCILFFIHEQIWWYLLLDEYMIWRQIYVLFIVNSRRK